MEVIEGGLVGGDNGDGIVFDIFVYFFGGFPVCKGFVDLFGAGDNGAKFGEVLVGDDGGDFAGECLLVPVK